MEIIPFGSYQVINEKGLVKLSRVEFSRLRNFMDITQFTPLNYTKHSYETNVDTN